MGGQCHICRRYSLVAYCPPCGHWMCEECRWKPWDRLKAALRVSYPGCCFVFAEAA